MPVVRRCDGQTSTAQEPRDGPSRTSDGSTPIANSNRHWRFPLAHVLCLLQASAAPVTPPMVKDHSTSGGRQASEDAEHTCVDKEMRSTALQRWLDK